jgi:hypothetical protein
MIEEGEGGKVGGKYFFHIAQILCFSYPENDRYLSFQPELKVIEDRFNLVYMF